MKKVLLLGDSIRLNYAPYVFRKLSDQAQVTGPEENCRFAKYTLHELPGWLKALGTPDVVHWNNGLWDLHHFDGQEVLTPLAEYLKDLERILTILKETGARIIFATSTPVRQENPDWDNKEIVDYNTAAVELMNKYHIPVNDLHALLAGGENAYISDDLIHLNRLGIQKAGQGVVDALMPLL